MQVVSKHSAVPEAQGLFNPENDKDACGVGFVAGELVRAAAAQEEEAGGSWGRLGDGCFKLSRCRILTQPRHPFGSPYNRAVQGAQAADGGGGAGDAAPHDAPRRLRLRNQHGWVRRVGPGAGCAAG